MEKPHAAVPGIIYPPPEVRNIVDKTANFVARNGPEFESRIRQNEVGNPKFNFLNVGDPYNAYYQHKVREFKEGKVSETGSAAQVSKGVASSTQQKQQELLKQAQAQEQPFIPKDPPAEFEFVADPPSISALELGIVKLTAQFVARNGRKFLTTLMNREQRNYQFDFLRPQHSLFQYFTKLLEQYTKILIPPKDLMKRLCEESMDQQVILKQVNYRADWQKHQEAQKRKEEMIIERERIAYAQIDWHDFVVVETVDYQIGELGNFPSPTTPEEVGARVLMQDRQATKKDTDANQQVQDDEMQMDSDDEMLDRTGMPAFNRGDLNVEEHEDMRRREGKDNTQVEDMDEESSESEDESSNAPQLTPAERKQFTSPAPPLPLLPPVPDKVIVKKGYDPKQAKVQQRVNDELISPLTGTKIPANMVQKHMRIGLLDPRWVEQQDYHMQDKMNQESVYAPGSAIEMSLKQLAERRTDIFGVGDEETAIGKKIGEEDIRKDDKITWDGHTSSVEAATRAARANITIEDQIHQIHKVKGLLPDEEKEKIGPKPVPEVLAAPPMRQMTIAPPAPLPKPPQMPTVVTSAPPLAQVRQPMNLLAAPNPMVMHGNMPQMTPMSSMMVPQVPVPQAAGGPPQVQVPQHPFPTLMPAGSGPVQAFMTVPQQPMPHVGMKHVMMDNSEDEPFSKKTRTEDSLEPEQQFMTRYRGPITFKVVLPSMPDKSEWKLMGQTLEFSLPLSDPVSVIKSKIYEAVNMPPGKQKLNWEGMFLKDSNSLAYYNVTPMTVLQLQLKERGGRKK